MFSEKTELVGINDNAEGFAIGINDNAPGAIVDDNAPGAVGIDHNAPGAILIVNEAGDVVAGRARRVAGDCRANAVRIVRLRIVVRVGDLRASAACEGDRREAEHHCHYAQNHEKFLHFFKNSFSRPLHPLYSSVASELGRTP